MSNKTRINHILLSFICALIITAPCISYATSRTVEITVLTNPEKEPLKNAMRVGGSNPRHQFILATKGVKKKGSEELFVADKDIYDVGHITVAAKCLSATRITEFVSMSPRGWYAGPLPVLVCKKGEGLYVNISSPFNPDPNYIRYIADLTRIEDEDERPGAEDASSVEESVSTPAAVVGSVVLGVPQPQMPAMGGHPALPLPGDVSPPKS